MFVNPISQTTHPYMSAKPICCGSGDRDHHALSIILQVHRCYTMLKGCGCGCRACMTGSSWWVATTGCAVSCWTCKLPCPRTSRRPCQIRTEMLLLQSFSIACRSAVTLRCCLACQLSHAFACMNPKLHFSLLYHASLCFAQDCFTSSCKYASDALGFQVYEFDKGFSVDAALVWLVSSMPWLVGDGHSVLKNDP